MYIFFSAMYIRVTLHALMCSFFIFNSRFDVQEEIIERGYNIS